MKVKARYLTNSLPYVYEFSPLGEDKEPTISFWPHRRVTSISASKGDGMTPEELALFVSALELATKASNMPAYHIRTRLMFEVVRGGGMLGKTPTGLYLGITYLYDEYNVRIGRDEEPDSENDVVEEFPLMSDVQKLIAEYGGDKIQWAIPNGNTWRFLADED